MDRYQKEVLQVSTRKHGINVQYLYDRALASDPFRNPDHLQPNLFLIIHNLD